MNHLLARLTLTFLFLSLHTSGVNALTTQQFSEICKSAPGKCSDLPIIQAYIGGALDLFATLDEKTEYLAPLYCKAPQVLFDIPAITRFVLEHQKQSADDNAMLVLIRYFEKHGGC